MSDFQLDVDSPYALPTRESVMVKPRRMPYPQSKITFKHYGKYVARLLQFLSRSNDADGVRQSVDNIARYMRIKSFEYNLDHPNNEVIIKDIKTMSGNGIELDETALNLLRNEYKNNHQQHQSSKGAKRQSQKAKQKSQQRQHSAKNHHRQTQQARTQSGSQHNTSR